MPRPRRPGAESMEPRSHRGGGGGGGVMGAIVGNKLTENPEYAKAKGIAEDIAAEGAPNPRGLMTPEEQGALTTPFKSNTFLQRLTGNTAADDINRAIAQQRYVGDLANEQYLQRASDLDKMDRDRFIFDNAESIKKLARQKFVDSTGVTPEDRPDLYQQHLSQAADEAYAANLAEKSAAKKEAISRGGTAERREEVEQALHPYNLEGADLTGQTGVEMARGALGRAGDINTALDVEARARPIQAAQAITHGSFIPLQGPMIRLNPNAAPGGIITPTSEKDKAAAALSGQQLPAATSSAFPGTAAMTLTGPNGPITVNKVEEGPLTRLLNPQVSSNIVNQPTSIRPVTPRYTTLLDPNAVANQQPQQPGVLTRLWRALANPYTSQGIISSMGGTENQPPLLEEEENKVLTRPRYRR